MTSRDVAALDAETKKNINQWLNGDFDDASKQEIHRLEKEDPETLLDAFYTRLSFGTGGLRGIMGVGTNRMNVYTVRAATQGLANYILKQATKEKKHRILIGYDCRHHSREFAEEAAKVLAANEIEALLYKELRPVALISFGVIYERCTAGIMITASHNPAIYNGYKVYWSYGGQVLPPHDQGIIDEVNKITSNAQVKQIMLPNPLVREVAEEIDNAYFDAIQIWQLHPGVDHSHGKELNVVYTSLFGGGITMIPRALRLWGFTNLHIVEEQAKPNGDFPGLKTPNPEDPAAMELGITRLKKIDGDLLIGTDPDTDRMGVVVMHENKPFFFNGNEIASMLLEYLCRSLKQTRTTPAKPMCIKTIVTTELIRSVADHYGLGCLDVLTGFKYIGQKIAGWEEEGRAGVPSHHFIFGGEESYGYLIGTHARDKDAIISAAAFCELALQLKLEKKNLIDFLYEIYQKYGVFREKLISLTFEGKEGVDKIETIMKKLRAAPPKFIAETEVDRIEDYYTRTLVHLKSGHKEPLTLPKSDVLRYWLVDGTKIVARPSGTEPKIKFYAGVREMHHISNVSAVKKAIVSCDQRLDKILNDFTKLIETK